VAQYAEALATLISNSVVTDSAGATIGLEDAVDRVRLQAQAASERGGKILFLGNGGSAGIASHLAIDYSKNGGLRSLALNDAAALTCLANDFGYEHVFEKQIEFHARPGDLVMAISSSGKSPNILRAADAATRADCTVVTFSGFRAGNPLRRSGAFNFYVDSDRYGFVEIAHLSICHAILDIHMGWNRQPSAQTNG
jgi:D-sedoheptulose 7-phosphate isomerase